ncbi:hypothetical protein C0995_003950 [Termitomyces sp. Mi166|nr:hypothetical protein C0995_003950 [Termitomyces sp. Mi166\
MECGNMTNKLVLWFGAADDTHPILDEKGTSSMIETQNRDKCECHLRVTSTKSTKGMSIGSMDWLWTDFLVIQELIVGWQEVTTSSAINDDISRWGSSVGFVAMTASTTLSPVGSSEVSMVRKVRKA